MTKFDTLVEISTNILKGLLYALIACILMIVVPFVLLVVGVESVTILCEAWCLIALIMIAISIVYLTYFYVLFAIGKIIEYQEDKKYREEFGNEETTN